MDYQLQAIDTLIISVIVLYVGTLLTRKFALLEHYNIPPAVTGGLLCSIVVALIFKLWGVGISFDLEIRDKLLLVFFSTIGLSAKFRLLAAGGKALLVLLVAAVFLLVIQNATGVLIALGLGVHPGYGLLGGSISFAGGHGTAIAWGAIAEKAGLLAAQEVGIAFATFGLIAGGLIGGPIAQWLITRHKLQSTAGAEQAPAGAEQPSAAAGIGIDNVLGTILLLAICVAAGDQVNKLLFSRGVVLPGFLTAMVVGIVLTNLSDVLKKPFDKPTVDLFSDVSLRLFLSMSLMSMNLTVLAQAAGPMLLVLMAQILAITVVAMFIVFRVMGRDYDASVITAGFAGLGLGATPVAIGNMQAVTHKYGPSPKAFLVVPLVGAFFIDLANALVIRFFLGLPVLQAG